MQENGSQNKRETKHKIFEGIPNKKIGFSDSNDVMGETNRNDFTSKNSKSDFFAKHKNF